MYHHLSAILAVFRSKRDTEPGNDPVAEPHETENPPGQSKRLGNQLDHRPDDEDRR